MPPIPCINPPSIAKLFLQLAARRTASTLAPSAPAPILDILLPPRTQSFRVQNASLGTYRTLGLRRAERRTFTTSRALAKTIAIHNPQKDDEGQDMILEITPRAANRLSQIMTKDKNPHLALRIQVQSGGCHGFQYIMSLTTLPSTIGATAPLEPAQVAEEITPSTTTSATPAPQALNEDDVIFAFAPDDATDAAPTDAKIVLDVPSLELLKGSKVDFTMELIGSQFKIVDNPMATSSCGCGTSFDIKV